MIESAPLGGALFSRFVEVLKTLGYNEAEIAATCPVTEEVFDHRFTHFPIYGLTKEQLDYMADAILESIDEMQKGI